MIKASFVAILLFSAAPLALAQHSVTISGAVRDTVGAPIAVASVRVVEGPRATPAMPVVLGAILLTVQALGSSITVEVSAPGYSTRRITADVVDGRADLRTIALVPLIALRIGEVRLFRLPADGRRGVRGREAIDFFLSNGAGSLKTVDTIVVIASRRRLTDCGDFPGLHSYVFQVMGALRATAASQELALDISGANGTDAAVAARGKMEYLPCRQARLRLEFFYPWDLQAGARTRVRLVMPRIAAAPPAKGTTELSLDSWEVAALQVVTSDGVRSEASVPTAARQ
jgi:hypothetical protein